MKYGILSLGLILFSACGTNQSPVTSELNESLEVVATPTVVSEITEIEPINGGINPNFLAFRFEGTVMTGSNRCQANGVKVEIRTERKDKNLFLTAYLLTPKKIEPVHCTREFMPQYETFSEVVMYDQTRTDDVILMNYQSMGKNVSYRDLMEAKTAGYETVLSNVAVQPTLGGFNPLYRALVVSGSVVLGSNWCHASGVVANLVEKKVGDTLYIAAQLSMPADIHERFCTFEYIPVSQTLEITVRYNSAEIKNVIIMNVDEMGQNKSALDFVGGRR